MVCVNVIVTKVLFGLRSDAMFTVIHFPFSNWLSYRWISYQAPIKLKKGNKLTDFSEKVTTQTFGCQKFASDAAHPNIQALMVGNWQSPVIEKTKRRKGRQSNSPSTFSRSFNWNAWKVYECQPDVAQKVYVDSNMDLTFCFFLSISGFSEICTKSLEIIENVSVACLETMQNVFNTSCEKLGEN